MKFQGAGPILFLLDVASSLQIIMPLMQTIIFLIYPLEKRGAAMGMFGLVIGFAPAIGPTLSGWFVDPIVIIDLIVAYFIRTRYSH